MAIGAHEEVAHLEAEFGDDVLRVAAGKALEERLAIVAFGHGEARLPVCVGRTQSLPGAVTLPNALQPLQDVIHRLHLVPSSASFCTVALTR